MKICLFNGGLGNQVFQYIFARYIEIGTGELCFLDDSEFFNLDAAREEEKKTGIVRTHNGYELERVFPNSKPNLLSKQFTPDVWEYMMEMCRKGISVPQQMLNMGTDMHLVHEMGEVKFDGEITQVPANKYYPQILKLAEKNSYYYGYWIAKGWLWENKEQVKEELQFPQITNKKNLKYQNAIRDCNSIGLHIRRGDFVDIGWVIEDTYYEMAVKTIDKHFNGDCIFFVFSDDLEWCSRNAENLGLDLGKDRVVYVEGNYDRKHNYVDMQLMTMCKHLIISHSSFSYLAALIHENEKRIVISPRSAREL